MKKLLLSTLFLYSFTNSLFSQHAGNSVGLNPVDYVEVPDNDDSSLDINDGFTFEAWVFNFGFTANQKVAGKLAGDFKNGFIYGIEDQQVNLEVFDNLGTNTKLKAGFVSGIGWTHLAGTYEVGGMLTIYINGIKVGETAASSALHDFNLNPFRIGIAPWDVNALGFVGYVDEVRYWNNVLDGITIRSWMHKDITDMHPNFDELGLYHKYNESAGPTVLDESIHENHGMFSATGGQSLEPLNLPFKGDFDLLENDVQGVWNAKTKSSSDILTVDALFFDTLEFAHSAVFGHSDGDYSIMDMTINGVAGRLSKAWQATTQGDFIVNLSFDLSGVDMSGFSGPVLLVSDDANFSDPSPISGNMNGNQFSITDEAFEDGFYYTVGFQNSTSTIDVEQNNLEVTVSPNPSNGTFSLVFDKFSPYLDLSIYDMQGKMVFRQPLDAGLLQHSLELQNTLLSGLYMIQLMDEKGGIVSRKLMVK